MFPLVPETQSTPTSTFMDNADANIVFAAQTSTGGGTCRAWARLNCAKRHRAA